MTRLNDWVSRLDAAVIFALDREFKWGEQDCASFALGCVAAMTGVDPGAEWRGRYDDALSATRMMRRFGDLTSVATTLLGSEPIPARMARRGDVLLATREAGPSLGICNGAMGLFVAPRGLARVNISECELAWRI